MLRQPNGFLSMTKTRGMRNISYQYKKWREIVQLPPAQGFKEDRVANYVTAQQMVAHPGIKTAVVVARGVPLAPSGCDGFKVFRCEGDVVVGWVDGQAKAAAGEDDSGPPGYAGHGEIL